MSYDLCLHHPVTKEIIMLDEPHFMRGWTYPFGGSREASINITWNYADFFCTVLGERGIRSIYGLSGAECISILKEAMAKLKDDVVDGYWKRAKGNAKTALAQILALSQMRPAGIWNGD